MSSTELSRLIHSRKFVRRQVTQIHDKVEEISSYTEIKRATVKAKITDFSEKLKSLDENVQSSMWSNGADESSMDGEFSSCESYADKINECICNINIVLPPASNVNITPHSTDTRSEAKSLLRCPVAPLPYYSGDPTEDLSRFLNQFEATIARFQYPEFDKLLLLKQKLKGRSLTLVESLEVGSQSYTKAVELLRSAFDSPEVRKFEIIRQLSDLRLTHDSDPYEFISQYRKLSESVNSLDISVETFLQFHFWSGLNESFKTHFVQLTNKTRPSLKELNSNFFDVCERYVTAKKSSSKYDNKFEGKNKNITKTESSYAARVDRGSENVSKARTCSLCRLDSTDDNHLTYQCPIYKDSKAKLQRIKNFNGCERCGNASHNSKNCKFRFRRRCHCGNWHFSFLCPGVSANVIAVQETQESVPPVTCSVASNVTSNSKGPFCSLGSQCVLPTFTCS